MAKLNKTQRFGALVAMLFALGSTNIAKAGEVPYVLPPINPEVTCDTDYAGKKDTFVDKGVEFNMNTPKSKFSEVGECREDYVTSSGFRFAAGLNDLELSDGRKKFIAFEYGTDNRVFEAEFNVVDGEVESATRMVDAYGGVFKDKKSKYYHRSIEEVSSDNTGAGVVTIPRPVDPKKKNGGNGQPLGTDPNVKKGGNGQPLGTDPNVKKGGNGQPLGTDPKVKKGGNGQSESLFVYLPLSNDGEISRIEYNPNFEKGLVKVDRSALISKGQMYFGDSDDLPEESVLLDFYMAGLVREFEGQGSLVLANQKGLVHSGGSELVGVSAYAAVSDKLMNLIGKEVVGPNGETHTITPRSLEDSLRHHIIHEKVAEYYNKHQKLENSYRVPVGDIVELNEAAKFLSETPIVRPLLPINNVVQDGSNVFRWIKRKLTGNDYKLTQENLPEYTMHTTTDRIEKINESGVAYDGGTFNSSLVEFEDGIEARVQKYFGGDLK